MTAQPRDRCYDLSDLRVQAQSLMKAADQAYTAHILLRGREGLGEVRVLLEDLAGLLAFTAGTLDYYANHDQPSARKNRRGGT